MYLTNVTSELQMAIDRPVIDKAASVVMTAGGSGGANAPTSSGPISSLAQASACAASGACATDDAIPHPHAEDWPGDSYNGLLVERMDKRIIDAGVKALRDSGALDCPSSSDDLVIKQVLFAMIQAARSSL